jgi:hypothetical protein
MIAYVYLFADLEDLLKLIVPILFIVVWVISQIMGNREAKPAPRQGPARPPADPDAPKQIDLRKEIESFLKQAAGGQEAIKEAQVIEEVQPPPRQRQGREVPLEAEVLDDSATSGRLTTRHAVSSHVQQHLDTHELVDHAALLGADLEQTDERLEARLQATFDHNLGQFQNLEAASTAGSSQTVSLLAEEIFEVFRNPREVRLAIILNEVLNRPDDRW